MVWSDGSVSRDWGVISDVLRAAKELACTVTRTDGSSLLRVVPKVNVSANSVF